MESRARAAGHAIHPMLVVFPLGLLTSAVGFDVIDVVVGDPRYGTAAFLMIAAGVVGGVVAGVFGFVDWLATPRGTRARRVGLWHALGNDVFLVLFAAAWLLRLGQDDHHVTPVAMALAVAGVVVSAVTGWLGGELIERLGVSVAPDAHLDAPSSLGATRNRSHGSVPSREQGGVTMPRTLNQVVGAVLGVVYLVVGLVGFAVTSGIDFAAREGDELFGLFELNPLHNVVHLAIGVALLFGALAGPFAARAVNATVGAAYGAVGIVGLFVYESSANVLATNGADNALHIGTGVVLLGTALLGSGMLPAADVDVRDRTRDRAGTRH